LNLLVVLGFVGTAFLPPSAGAAESAAPIIVDMAEFGFRPATITLRAGRPAILRLVNRGQIAHQIETALFHQVPLTVTDAVLSIEPPALTVLRLRPGATARVRFFPQVSGRFPFACTIEGHREAGMTGVCVVR